MNLTHRQRKLLVRAALNAVAESSNPEERAAVLDAAAELATDKGTRAELLQAAWCIREAEHLQMKLRTN